MKGLHHQVGKIQGLENLSLWQRLDFFLPKNFSGCKIMQFNPKLRHRKKFIKCRFDSFSMGFIPKNLSSLKINNSLKYARTI